MRSTLKTKAPSDLYISETLQAFTRTLDNRLQNADRPKNILESIETVLQTYVTDPDMLTDTHKTGCPDGYKRHLLYVNKDIPFSVLCLVWRPGQASPVHGHETWCVVGIAEGELTVETYDKGDTGKVSRQNQFTIDAGDTCIERPRQDDIHKIINNSDKTAISLHIYGMDLSTSPHKVNTLYE